jgi:hypothetical protein
MPVTNETVANVYHQDKSGFALLSNATYDQIARFVTDHPERARLRVVGEFFPTPLTADEFAVRYRKGV